MHVLENALKLKKKSTFMILGRVKYVNVSKKSMNC